MLSSPILGSLSDRIGRRPILLSCLAMTSVVYLLMANVQTIFQLLCARAALGLCSGAATVEVALVSDLTSKSERVFWVNMQARLQSAGCILGPAIGGMVAPYSRIRLETHFEFEHLCYSIALLVLVNFIIGAIFFTRPPPVPRVQVCEEQDRPKSGNPFGFMQGAATILLLACFMDAFSLAVSDGPEAYFLHDKFGFEPRQQATFMMICSGSSLLWGTLAPYVVGLFPPKLCCVFFSLCSSSIMVLMSLCREWWTPYLYSALFGCSVTIVEVATKTSLVGRLVPERHQGAVYGTAQGLLNLGYSLGPLVGGAIYVDSLGLPYEVSACCLVISALVYLSLPSSMSQGGSPLLDTEESATEQALAHWSNQAPLPAKRIGAVLSAEKARRVYFVCPELYEAYRAQQDSLNRRHSSGEPGQGPTTSPKTVRSNTISSFTTTAFGMTSASNASRSEPQICRHQDSM
ncbi:unnamed protein product [Effrenium voratum]|nr:unnamed protein product [Effrenium voratum]